MAAETRAQSPHRKGGWRLWLWVTLAAALGCSDPQPTPGPPASLSRPQALLYTEAGLLISNSGYTHEGWEPGRLSLVDPEGGALLAELTTPYRNPQRLVRRGGWIYVIQTGALDFSTPEAPGTEVGGISAYPIDDLRGDAAPLTLALPDPSLPSGPIDLAFSGARGLVTLATQPYALLFDADALTWIRGPQDPIPLGEEGVSLAAVAAWRELFLVVEFNHDRLYVITAEGERWPCAIELGVSRDIEGAQSPAVEGDTLYFLLSLSGTLRAVDLEALLAAGPSGCGAIEPKTVISPLGQVPNDLHVKDGRAYVVHSGENNVVAYNLDGGAEVTRWALAPGSNPWHMAFSGEGRFAVTEWTAQAVSFFREGSTKAYLRFAGEQEAARPSEGEPHSYTARCADVVVEAVGATGEGYGDPQMAVNGVRGAGASAGSTDVYSVPLGEALILRWSGRVIEDAPGPDLVVFENPFEYGSGGIFMDLIIVEASTDGVEWAPFPHDYRAADETRYSTEPEDWEGFAGRTPTHLNVDNNPLDPLDEAAGGDRFDLAELPGALGDEIRREGARYIRLRSAMEAINPDTGAPYPADPTSNGVDIDGVCAGALMRDEG